MLWWRSCWILDHVSLVQQQTLSQDKHHNWTSSKILQDLQLVTTSGEDLPIVDYVRARIEVGELNLLHDFVVAWSLVAQVILGVDFLHNNALTLDFTTTPVSIQHAQSSKSSEVTPFFDAASKSKAKTCAISTIQPSPIDNTDECAIQCLEEL